MSSGTNTCSSSSNGASRFSSITNIFTADRRDSNSSSTSDSSSHWSSDSEHDDVHLYDLLENGYARESVTQECLTPRPPAADAAAAAVEHTTAAAAAGGAGGDQRFYVKRIGKDRFEMFGNEDDRFMLSAKREGSDFVISPYRPDAAETSVAANRTCAVLKRCRTGKSESYRLYLAGCEGCNRRREKYQVNEYPINADGMTIDQQLLAEIKHSTTIMPEVDDLLMRKLAVTIPDETQGGAGWADGGRTLSLKTKLPRFQANTGCLVQKFNGNRVKDSSAKNFMLVTADADETFALQFGKSKSKTYILDHCAPLGTLQAFGISLSMCNWLGE
jgi:hypothetical protein